MKIVVLDGHTMNPGDNPWTPLQALGEAVIHERTAPDQVVSRSREAGILVVNKVELTRDVLAQLPLLRMIAVTATGYNVVDVAAARERNIPVCNVPVYSTDSVAQFVFALLLELCHHVGLHHDEVTAGAWSRSPDFSFWKTPLVELTGLTMGIVGFGRIGRRVGELAHAFGMRVLAFNRHPGPAPAYESFAWSPLNDLVSQSDVVSLHCPLTPENKGMVNRQLLSRMKTTAFLVNTARGPLVAERDLAEALNGGRIAGAAVDVVSAEPIRADNPLLTARHCIITPHMAWATLAARRRLMAATVENVKCFLEGRPVNGVNCN